MLRYTQYCTRNGLNPQWQNVYNTVNVFILPGQGQDELTNQEFRAAQFLDDLSEVRVTNHLKINETLSFDQIVFVSAIHEGAAVYNNQNCKTTAFKRDN